MKYTGKFLSFFTAVSITLNGTAVSYYHRYRESYHRYRESYHRYRESYHRYRESYHRYRESSFFDTFCIKRAVFQLLFFSFFLLGTSLGIWPVSFTTNQKRVFVWRHLGHLQPIRNVYLCDVTCVIYIQSVTCICVTSSVSFTTNQKRVFVWRHLTCVIYNQSETCICVTSPVSFTSNQ